MKTYYYVKGNNYYGCYQVCQAELSPQQVERERGGFLWAKRGVLEFHKVMLFETWEDAETLRIYKLCD